MFDIRDSAFAERGRITHLYGFGLLGTASATATVDVSEELTESHLY